MKKANIKDISKRKGNSFLLSLVETLNKEKKPIWKSVAYELSRPRRKKVEVNVSKIDVYTKEGASVVIPGKVLGAGKLSKKVLVAAFSFSDSAKAAIEAAGGKAMSIEALLKSNPTGREVMIIK